MNSQLARVLRAEREHYTLLHNGIEIPAVLSGKFRLDSNDFPAVGDWVALRPGTNAIEEIAPRKSVFRRKQAGSAVEAQVMAANIDLVFIVTGLDHDFNLRRMERYVLVVKECGALPVLVLNKADVCPDIGAVLAQVRSVACGDPVVVISALAGDSLDPLTACVSRGETAALIGSSGVGKTTIVNRLLGAENRATQAGRDEDS